MKRPFAMWFVAGALFLPGTVTTSGAQAEPGHVIRLASLAPPGSAFMKVLKAWNRSLQKETEGRVEIRFYSGGSQGDERDYLRKIRAGQMDAAAVTTVGLGIVERSVSVLTAPGVIVEYPQLTRALDAISDRLAEKFDKAGFAVFGWGQAGKNRIFSVEEFQRPSDLKGMRPWVWKDDPVFAEYIHGIGANAVRLGLPEVYPGLQTRMVDVVPASAIAAVALQWHTRLNYIANRNFNLIVGAMIVKKEKLDALSPGDRKAVIDTGNRTAKALDVLVRRDDARARDSMVNRGMIEVDLAPHQAEWDDLAKNVRENLAGRVYSKSFLEVVERAVH